MKKYLLVEDSTIVIKIIKHISKSISGFDYDVASSFGEAKALIAKNGADHYFVAVVDLNLPDAPDGQVVDFTINQQIPTIVLTGTYDDEKREKMLSKKIVDYVVKESRFSYEYVMKLIQRLSQNQEIKILVADDSKVSRNYIRELLKTHRYNVITADDGDTALELLEQHPDIKLLITDYNMPRMNGFELVKNIRREISKNDLVIIGLSGEGDGKLTAKFIKNGANDFLNKPFSHEEFHCRIMHNIESLEYALKLKYLAFHDYVSGLPNKQKFFLDSEIDLDKAHKQSAPISLAIISVDHLNTLQDKYGLEAPDATMKSLAAILPKAFGRFSYARISDSNIAVLLSGLSLDQASKLIESFRVLVEDQIVLMDQISFNFTISSGIFQHNQAPITDLLRQADNRLYLAKENGGNVIWNED
ncbi:MAG: diguanylate cyclase (GGDEF)-like protein [Oleiphilaceae bacterium]|jgi:diguanylate cyclase (GGDEF)-like protein